MVIEAGVAAGYVVAWALRKARQVGGRLDAEVDEVIDASLDRLHEVVATKLDGHPVLAELVEEAGEAAASGAEQVSELMQQQVELTLAAAARKDELFGQVVTELVGRLREAEQASGRVVASREGAALFTGDAHAEAKDGGIAFGQVAGGVQVHQDPPGPTGPGRSDR